MKKQILINFHLHSTGSDGKLTPEEVVKDSIKAGIKYICFTDHYRLPWTSDFRNKFFLEDYIREVHRLQKGYASQINIAFGAEFDWLEGHENWTSQEIKKRNYDYIIGSIHSMKKLEDYHQITLKTGDKNKWLEAAEKFGGIKRLVEEYYRQARLLIKSGLFDCLGHLDIIKMFNYDQSLFKEDDAWYKKEVKSVLNAVQKSGMTIELNVRGLNKTAGVQYPSLWILKEAKKRNIPLTIGSDAHHPGEVAKDLDKAYEFAKKAGYKEIVRFEARKMIQIPII